MNNDVLSPVCGGALFFCVFQWLRAERPTILLGALTGLTIGATLLTKLSNLPLIAVALVVIILRVLSNRPRAGSATVTALAALVICAAVPTGSWMLWAKSQFGDVTGSTAKIAFLDWTRKPLAEWWQHPIFTPRGFWIFWSDLMANFWRGEVKWHGQILRWLPADGFYAVSSFVLLVAAVIGLRKNTGLSTFQRQAICVSVFSFTAAVAFLALLSIQFDFGDCVNPSRAHPYFTSGRLLSGALIPFALFYVYGLTALFRRTNSAVPLMVLTMIIVSVATSEIISCSSVFASEHNWFHR